jgi:hypothetical protein
MVNIRKNSFAPFKVAWKRMGNKINAGVLSPLDDPYIGQKPLIAQETVSFIPLRNDNEAHYLCSILNSTQVGFLVKSFSQLGGKSFATPSILEQINIPRYETANKTHKRLAQLSKKTHELASKGIQEELAKVEDEIDNLVGQLYGLTDKESQEIKESLRALESGAVGLEEEEKAAEEGKPETAPKRALESLVEKFKEEKP